MKPSSFSLTYAPTAIYCNELRLLSLQRFLQSCKLFFPVYELHISSFVAKIIYLGCQTKSFRDN